MALTQQQLEGMSTEDLLKLKQGLQEQPQQGLLPQRGGVLGGLLSGAYQGFTGQKAPAGEKTDSDLANKMLLENYKRGLPPTPEEEANLSYKKSQTELNNKILQSLSESDNDNLVYRDPLTGAEVPSSQALIDISQGKNYIISRKEITRGGAKEVPITSIEDIRKDEELKEQKAAMSEGIKSKATDMLDSIRIAKEGIKNFGVLGKIPSTPGTQRYTWQSHVDKLLSDKIVQLMNDMKQASKTGATGFGQLSEKELQLLREASTVLNRGLEQGEALRILNKLESGLKKIVSEKASKPMVNTTTQEKPISEMTDDELNELISRGK